ncbi:MAG TPA: VWA domain-containing protein [Candidatus Limnocylindrales bacterium]|jgi:Ca-activated chloride channel family protein
MTFLWPAALLLLALVPLGIIWDRRVAQRRAARLAASGLGAGPQTTAGAGRRRLVAVLIVAGLVLAIVALARPQGSISLPRHDGIVVLALDVSGSMAATDIEPTRMAAAREAAKAFVERQPEGVIVGVVAFSDGGIAVQSPTRDQATLVAAIDRLQPSNGTSLGQGILVALHAVDIALDPPEIDYYSRAAGAPTPPPTPEPTPVPAGQRRSAVIVLLSDGENNERPDPLEAAQAAADRGVRIDTVAIGSPEGVDLDLDGFVVHTALNAELLEQVAEASGGQAYRAADTESLMAIYEGLDPQFVIEPETIELTGIVAGLAVLLLITGGLLSLRWLGRLP